MVEGAGLGMVDDHSKNAWGTTKIYRYTRKVIVVELQVNFALNDLLWLLWLNQGF